MSHDDEVCLKFGREFVRMVADLGKATGGETGYIRRRITFRGGGAVDLFIANDDELADLMENVAREKYDVQDKTPPSQMN